MTNKYQILKRKTDPESGYTLIELMMVVAITAIIAGITMSSINSTSHKLRGTAQALRAKMQQAKLLAIKENCNVFVDFDTSNDNYTLWRDLNNNGSYDTGAPELIETVPLPNDISFGAVANGDGGPDRNASNSTPHTAPTTNIVSFSGDRVRFSPQGTGSNGWAYLHAPNNDASGTHAAGSNNVGRIQSRYWVTGGGNWR